MGSNLILIGIQGNEVPDSISLFSFSVIEVNCFVLVVHNASVFLALLNCCQLANCFF